jgi:hypothetical protein
METMNLPPDADYIFSFGRFVDFNENIHGKAMNYLFDKTNHIKKEVVGEDDATYHVTYKFANREDFVEYLSKDQMLFLCAVCHNLNLKSYLSAIIEILMNDLKLSFDDIKTYSKDDSFTMQIFTTQ